MSIDRMIEDLEDEREYTAEDRADDRGDYLMEQDRNDAYERSQEYAARKRAHMEAALAKLSLPSGIKLCAYCGNGYTIEQFRMLPPCSNGGLYMGDGDGNRLELRNCGCGNTLSINVGAAATSPVSVAPPDAVPGSSTDGTLSRDLKIISQAIEDAFASTDDSDNEVRNAWYRIQDRLSPVRT